MFWLKFINIKDSTSIINMFLNMISKFIIIVIWFFKDYKKRHIIKREKVNCYFFPTVKISLIGSYKMFQSG